MSNLHGLKKGDPLVVVHAESGEARRQVVARAGRTWITADSGLSFGIADGKASGSYRGFYRAMTVTEFETSTQGRQT